MRKLLVFVFILTLNLAKAQVVLRLDSMLKVAYIKKYHFSENLMCVPFYCDPFYETFYKKGDTNGLCGKYVFVNRNFELKIRPGFSLPCSFEPRFGEGLCAVNIGNKITFIDTLGKVQFTTNLSACSPQRNKILPFKNGKAKVYKGSNTLKHFYEVYYIDKQGKRIPEKVMVHVVPKKVKQDPVIIAAVPKPNPLSPPPPPPVFQLPDLPKAFARSIYPIDSINAKRYLAENRHQDNRMLLYFDCGSYQLENMDMRDTIYCGKFVFTDSNFHIKIAGGFKLPCGFQPEFSEGLCAVAIDSLIDYIDTEGRVVIQTGLKACGPNSNKASTFRNGIATLYIADTLVKGMYTTLAINTKGERVRLLEFDDLELAEKKLDQFSNLNAEEAVNCFVGKGKTNGIWFLIEKSGKVRKKLELKR
jgi:hypothetical protein